MSRAVEEAERLVAGGRLADAVHLLDEAVKAGDGLAAFELGHWRLTGALIRRDLALARDHFLKAAELGVGDAQPVSIALLANGAGNSGRHWARALELLRAAGASDASARKQLDLLGAMSLDADGNPREEANGTPLCPDPPVLRFANFLSSAECAYLIEKAAPLLEPAAVLHPQTGQLIRDPIRSSTSAAFPFVAEDPVLHAINRRIARATATSYEQGEPLQVLSYEPGQQYKLHSDALAGDPNQRVVTFLVYLNNDYSGGETAFPDLDLTIRGQSGEGLLFGNVDATGAPHPRARHAGLPVTQGRKMLLSKWIRGKPLDLSGPPGRPF